MLRNSLLFKMNHHCIKYCQPVLFLFCLPLTITDLRSIEIFRGVSFALQGYYKFTSWHSRRSPCIVAIFGRYSSGPFSGHCHTAVIDNSVCPLEGTRYSSRCQCQIVLLLVRWLSIDGHVRYGKLFFSFPHLGCFTSTQLLLCQFLR